MTWDLRLRGGTRFHTGSSVFIVALKRGAAAHGDAIASAPWAHDALALAVLNEINPECGAQAVWHCILEFDLFATVS